MKLQIGSGDVYLPGWENVDVLSTVRADKYANATALPYPRETFELIYASHVLEHVNRHMLYATIFHWYDLLVDGGILRISVPNFEAICKHYLKNGDITVIMGLLYGGQSNILDEHHVAFDYGYISSILYSAGFNTVRDWNWNETEHSEFDDYSQAYLPHMDKENGMLMSLNVEAVK